MSPVIMIILFVAVFSALAIWIIRSERQVLALSFNGPAPHGNNPNLIDFQRYMSEGNRLYSAYHYEEAMQQYMAAAKVSPQEGAPYYRMGKIYQAMENFLQAESVFQKATGLSPDLVAAYYDLARIQLKLEKPHDALLAINRLLDKKVDDLDAKKFKLQILIEIGDFAQTKALLKELKDADPDNMDYLELLAKISLKEHLWDESLEWFDAMLALDPLDHRDVKFTIYTMYRDQKVYDKALETLQDILDTGSGTMGREATHSAMADCWFRQGQEAFSLGNWDEAIEFYEKAIGYDPNLAYIYAGFGQLFAAQGLIDKAIEYYEKCLDMGCEHPQVFLEIAYIYEAQDDYDKALEYACQSEALLPSPQVYYYIGTLKGCIGDYEGAIRNLEQAVNKSPSFVDACYNLAVAYEHDRKLNEAYKLYKRVLELDKNHVEAKTNLKHIQTRMNKW